MENGEKKPELATVSEEPDCNHVYSGLFEGMHFYINFQKKKKHSLEDKVVLLASSGTF